MLPMKFREDESMIYVYREAYDKLEGLRHKPKMHILDIEYSKCIQTFFKKKGTKRHHITPDNHHQVNTAEPAVKTANTISLRH